MAGRRAKPIDRDRAGGGAGDKRTVRSGYLTLVFLLLSASPIRAQFGAFPVIMNFAADGPEVEALTLLSEADEPIVLRLYLGDFDQHPEGRHEWGTWGQHPRSCEGRASVSVESVELDPGETFPVRVTMRPGADTCWSAVFIERVVPEGSFRVAQRIAVKVHGEGAEPVPDATVRAVTVTPSSDSLTAIVTVHNTGNTALRPFGDLEVRTLTGEVLLTVPVAPFSVLPGHVRVVRIPLPADLPAGDLLAIPILDIGEEYLLGGQATFRAAAPPER